MSPLSSFVFTSVILALCAGRVASSPVPLRNLPPPPPAVAGNAYTGQAGQANGGSSSNNDGFISLFSNNGGNGGSADSGPAKAGDALAIAQQGGRPGSSPSTSSEGPGPCKTCQEGEPGLDLIDVILGPHGGNP